MSDQFYSYLAEKIIEFFRINPLTPGSKYNIQFEKEEEVRELYFDPGVKIGRANV